MSLHPRLGLALAPGGLTLPEGRIAVFAPRAGQGLDPLPRDHLHLITGFYPDHAAFAAAGYAVGTAPEGRYAAALVILPRAKALARDLIARAREVTDGPILVDGAKDDGIESILKACRKVAEVGGPINKAHGKLFWITGGSFADWRSGDDTLAEGYVTAPGVFSADGIDPASALLAESLPEKLGPHVIDMGAGWGYLSARALERPAITRIDLVEADHTALACARQNVTDPRATFHWADATQWRPDDPADTIIMNPPFHTARKADPELGRAFLRNAAACLKPKGQLWLVANRHLPYEPLIAELFAESAEVDGNNRFKVIRAASPSRLGRRDRLG